MENPCWCRLLHVFCQELYPAGLPCWISLLLKDHAVWKRFILEMVTKNCNRKEASTLEPFLENCILWESLYTGEGVQEEGVAETKCYRLTETPIPHPSCAAQQKDVKNSGEKLSLRRRAVEGRFFTFVFICHCPNVLLTGNKFNLPQIRSVLPRTTIA